jgi:hypothetical protein
MERPRTWAQVCGWIGDEVLETWECGRALNPRGDRLLVIKIGRTRWRSDTRRRTSVRKLREDGWLRVHACAVENLGG